MYSNDLMSKHMSSLKSIILLLYSCITNDHKFGVAYKKYTFFYLTDSRGGVQVLTTYVLSTWSHKAASWQPRLLCLWSSGSYSNIKWLLIEFIP